MNLTKCTEKKLSSRKYKIKIIKEIKNRLFEIEKIDD